MMRDDIASGEVWPDLVELERAGRVADAVMGVAIARLRLAATALTTGPEVGGPTTVATTHHRAPEVGGPTTTAPPPPTAGVVVGPPYGVDRPAL